jgi:hypothetical protein
MNICVGARVRYTRGVRWQVLGRTGVVRSSYLAHSATMLEVDFGVEVYNCWVENVVLVPEEGVRPLDEFSDIEVVTDH